MSPQDSRQEEIDALRAEVKRLRAEMMAKAERIANQEVELEKLRKVVSEEFEDQLDLDDET